MLKGKFLLIWFIILTKMKKTSWLGLRDVLTSGKFDCMF